MHALKSSIFLTHLNLNSNIFLPPDRRYIQPNPSSSKKAMFFPDRQHRPRFPFNRSPPAGVPEERDDGYGMEAARTPDAGQSLPATLPPPPFVNYNDIPPWNLAPLPRAVGLSYKNGFPPWYSLIRPPRNLEACYPFLHSPIWRHAICHFDCRGSWSLLLHLQSWLYGNVTSFLLRAESAPARVRGRVCRIFHHSAPTLWTHQVGLQGS